MAKLTCHVFSQRVLAQKQTAGRQDVGKETMITDSSPRVSDVCLQNQRATHETVKMLKLLRCYKLQMAFNVTSSCCADCLGLFKINQKSTTYRGIGRQMRW